jgi:hypothetical protein
MAETAQTILLPRDLPREKMIARVSRLLYELPMDKAWRVQISQHKSPRSDAQNRYLNGVCYKLIGDAIGYERDEISEYMCGRFFGWKEKRVPKKPSNPHGVESVPLRTTTTDENGRRSVLGKTEFAEYVAFIQRFAASKGVMIPDPDPDHAEHEEAA